MRFPYHEFESYSLRQTSVRICSLASQNPLKNRRIFDFYSVLMFMSVRLKFVGKCVRGVGRNAGNSG